MSSTAVRRNGPYAPLGANYADDDAIAALDLQENDRAELLFVRGLAYCARNPRTEGYISDVALHTGKVLARRKKRGTDTVAKAADDLVALGLWVREGDGFRLRSWLKWNKTWDEISQGRAKDRARKSSGPDGTDDGSPTDSGRKPNGLQAPQHVTSLHGTSRHVTSGQQHATGDAGPRGGGTEARTLLDEHQAQLGDLPGTTTRSLVRLVGIALEDGTSREVVHTALAEWRRRPGAKPGLLPHLIDDASRAHVDDDPLAHPDAQAFLAAQNGAAR